MKNISLVIFLMGLLPLHSTAQEENLFNDTSRTKQWKFDLAATLYLFKGGDYLVMPDFKVDKGHLHLQGRYNYEDEHTTSLWAGYNFEVGKELKLKASPMIGGVAGNINGMASGIVYTLSYKKIEWYSEGEYFFSFENKEDDYFYVSSDLSYSFTRFFWLGIELNRSRIFKSERDVQRGILVGASYKRFIFNGCVYEIGSSNMSAGLTFEFKF